MPTIRVPTDQPTIADAMAVASPGDTIALDPGYAGESATVAVDDLLFDGDSSNTGIALTLAVGIAKFQALGSASWTVFGNSGDSTITTGSGDDFIQGQDGLDTLDGGAGFDTASYEEKTSSVVVTLNGSTSVSVTVGGSVEDTIRNIEDLIGGSGADTLNGDNNSNILSGGDGDDLLQGGKGDDVVQGGLGKDTLNGGAGFDAVDYSDKTDSVVLTLDGGHYTKVTVGGVVEDSIKNIEDVVGGDAGDTLTGDAAENFIFGGSGDDLLMGSAGDDLLDGEGDDDVLSGGAGQDLLDGGAGVDTVDYSDKAGPLFVDLSGSTGGLVLIGPLIEDEIINIENVIGGIGNDTLIGDDAANLLSGGAGDDLLQGGLGADVLDGGAGVDTADFSDKTSAVVVALAGAGSASVTVGGVAEDTLISVENVLGGSGADTLTGDANANVLAGGAGNDILQGGRGSDALEGGLGIDTADYRNTSGSVVATLSGAASATVVLNGLVIETDTLTSIESIYGGTANDTLTGNAQANVLYGYTGYDVLKGGAGADTLDGYSGFDTADYSDKTASVAVAWNPSGYATVTVGGVAEDTIRKIENVIGGTAGDTLTGTAGTNAFAGGDGNDTLTGGAGPDTFIFNTAPSAATNLDHITDFASEDTIDLENGIFTALSPSAGTLASSAFYSAAGATSAHDADDRIVYDTTTGTLYYDADGDQSGGAAAIEFAVLDTQPAITNADFFVV